MSGLRITCTTCGQANRVPEERLGQGPRCGSCGDPLLTGKVAELDLATHDKLIRDDRPVVIDYWAPWCGPCRAMAPEFARAAAAGSAARFAKIDTERHPAIAQRLAIRGIPLLIRWQRGRETGRLAGARPMAEIAAFAAGG